MRHTLLPTSDVRALKTEYRIRLVVVSLFFISFAIVVGAISLFPAYLSATGSVRDLARQAAEAENGVSTTSSAISTELANAAGTVSLVSSSLSPSLSGVVERVASYASAGISLTSFDVERSSNAASSTLVLQGVASTRDDLVSFERVMSADAAFSGVSVPISDLAPSTDLQFSLQASAATPTGGK